MNIFNNLQKSCLQKNGINDVPINLKSLKIKWNIKLDTALLMISSNKRKLVYVGGSHGVAIFCINENITICAISRKM
jgi:hypothetical protein